MLTQPSVYRSLIVNLKQRLLSTQETAGLNTGVAGRINTWKTKTPETKTPESKAPETKSLKPVETKTVETKAPETKSPKVAELKKPEPKTPEAKSLKPIETKTTEKKPLDIKTPADKKTPETKTPALGKPAGGKPVSSLLFLFLNLLFSLVDIKAVLKVLQVFMWVSSRVSGFLLLFNRQDKLA